MSYASLFSALADPAKETPAPMAERYQSRLVKAGFTDQQIAAVLADDQPTIVVTAGAGAGKTKTLIQRLDYLLERRVRPDDILVCTFTRKAAAELKKRLGKPLPYCGTVHSLALSLMGGGRQLDRMGVRLINEADYEALATVAHENRPEEFADYSVREFLLYLQRAQEEQSEMPAIRELLDRWEAELEDLGYWDFALLLKRALTLDVKKTFSHILVDEAQDLTALQQAWLRKVSGPATCFYYVGDDDQSVYSFRGTAKGVLAHKILFQGARHFPIHRNFRCARSIVNHANRVIERNLHRVGDRLIADRKEQGSVAVQLFEHTRDEVAACLDWFAESDPAKSCMVLGRTRDLLAPFAAMDLPVQTIHEAKGLEWDRVWVCGLELGVLPHLLGDREEERRLMYVAMTRARFDLILSAVKERELRDTVYHYKPSPFLLEAQGLAPV